MARVRGVVPVDKLSSGAEASEAGIVLFTPSTPAGGGGKRGRGAAGSPSAVRAAGTACGANPIGLVIPCHRIVRADGDLGNYGSGIERKEWLLAHERRYAR